MTMTKVNKGTQKAQGIIWDLNHNRHLTDIYSAYGRPSSTKVNTFRAIQNRAYQTEGYNHDLHISGAGSHFYSTVYSFTQDGITYVVKDTAANTYITEM